MRDNISGIHILSAATVILLFIVTLSGVLSWDGSKTYDTVNQYGDTVKMWGSGIYAHDSFFKATVQIGSDMCTLFAGVPLTIPAIITKSAIFTALGIYGAILANKLYKNIG